MHEHDHAERAEAAGLQSGEVVPGDVLHDAPTALDHAAVTGYERDAEQMVLDRSEAVSQRPRGRGRDDGAEGASGQTGRIDREPRPPVGELLAQLIESDACLGGRCEVGGLDGRDAVEAARGECKVGGGVALKPGSRALDAHPPTFLMRGAEEEGDRIRRSGRDAGHTIGAGLEDGPFPQQRGHLVENGHDALASVG